MRRVDRAKAVRDHILKLPAERWVWKQWGSARSREIDGGEWKASYWTPFAPLETGPRPASTHLQALILQNLKPAMPYQMDLWLVGSGKVLSVEWDGDDIHLISMKRGDWETDLFGLPPRS